MTVKIIFSFALLITPLVVSIPQVKAQQVTLTDSQYEAVLLDRANRLFPWISQGVERNHWMAERMAEHMANQERRAVRATSTEQNR